MTRKGRADRRLDLIAAAHRAIIRYGTEGVHLNHVAEEAGLTSGAVLYHYPRLGELLVDAHHAGMERFYEQRLKRINGMRDPAEKLVVTIRSGLPHGPDDPDVRLLNELGGAAARNRMYALLLTTLYDRQVSLYQSILDTGAALGTFTLTGDSLVDRSQPGRARGCVRLPHNGPPPGDRPGGGGRADPGLRQDRDAATRSRRTTRSRRLTEGSALRPRPTRRVPPEIPPGPGWPPGWPPEPASGARPPGRRRARRHRRS